MNLKNGLGILERICFLEINLTYLTLHRVGVELAHVGTGVLEFGLNNVEEILLSPLITDLDAWIVRDDMHTDRLYGFGVSLDPSDL